MSTPTSYDEIPYPGRALPATHPDRLAATAVLWGMEPPPVAGCRVLELGCGTGTNLISIAVGLPEARLLGIDSSAAQIAAGRALADRLGLRNVELVCGSIADLSGADEKVDYIVCHGVYSWIPEQVRQRILSLCRERLAPRGVAYISFNTQPGWHLRERIREMVLFHVHGVTAPRERLAQARSFLDFLSDSLRERKDAYACMLREEVDELRTDEDSYVFHEYLEEENRPFYFHEFMERAAAHGLQYLDEAMPWAQDDTVPPGAQQALAAAGADRIGAEQYMDFLRGRPFRRTLLVHREIRLRRVGPLESLARLRVAGAVSRTETPTDPQGAAEFATSTGVKLKTNHPVVIATLTVLGEAWPASLMFDELLARARRSSAEAARLRGPEVNEQVAAWLLRCHQAGAVELRTNEPPVAVRAGERPRASPLARLQAADPASAVSSLRHHSMNPPPFERRLLSMLDGTLDRRALLERLSSESAERTDHDSLADQIETSLQRLVRACMLLP